MAECAMRSDEEISRYAAAYRARSVALRAAEQARAREIRERLPNVAAMLRRDFGVSRVGYFGSLAGGHFAEGSDVDVYVDRIRSGSYFDALDRVAEMLDLPVDLVEIELAPESIRETIAESGVELGD